MKQFRNTWYYVTEQGEVYNSNTKKWLKITEVKGSYPIVRLNCPMFSGTIRVHRLVAECFINNFSNDLTVNHKDGNKCNNNVDNLECITVGANIRHAYKNKLIKQTKKDNKKRIDKQQVIELFKQYGNRTTVSKELNISRTSVSKICKGL